MICLSIVGVDVRKNSTDFNLQFKKIKQLFKKRIIEKGETGGGVIHFDDRKSLPKVVSRKNY